jgi:hypothetical protein
MPRIRMFVRKGARKYAPRQSTIARPTRISRESGRRRGGRLG